MDNLKKILIIGILTASLTGCTGNFLGSKPQISSPPPAELPEIQPTVMVEIPEPTSTASILPTETPQPSVFNAEVTATTLNLRSGPGMLHNIIGQYPKGEVVTVIGRAPGNGWVKILTKTNVTGWMNVQLLDLKSPISSAPELTISESLVAVGKVVDSSGKGIPGIQVAVNRIGGATRVRVESITGEDGMFYSYAPVEYQGTWLVTIIGVGCTSPIVDVNCRYAGKFEPVDGVNIKLPQDVEVLITYR